jgi:hypothetical protein
VISSGKFALIPVEKVDYQVSDAGVVIDTVSFPNEGDADNMFIQSYVNGNSIESIFEIPFTTLKTNPFYTLLGSTINYLKPKQDVVDGIIFPSTLYTGEYRAASDIRGSGCSFRGQVIWKYVGTARAGLVRTVTNFTSPWIVYKYSDVLLMKAEALNQMGLQTHNEGAQTLYRQSINSMNEVRTARNAVKTADYRFNGDVDGKTLEKTILDERAREFSYEGKRWYDVLRFAKRGNYGGNNIQYLVNLAISSASPEKQQSLIAKYKDPFHNSHYWPIFITELETNKALTQNVFYAK